MANTRFQNNNGAVVIDHTTISTPSNILIKGTNQAPERKNLFSKSLFQDDSMITMILNHGDSGFLQRYGSTMVFSNKGSDERSCIQVEHSDLKGWLDPNTANEKYTITFKINRVVNFKDNVNLVIMNGTANMNITSETKGIFSKTGTFSQWNFDTNYATLLSIDLPVSNISETGKCKEVAIEIELISFELGDHTNDPLLYMPETPHENSVATNILETPIVSSNTLNTVGDYRVDGELPLFLKQLEDSIAEVYDFYKPSKRELNLTYTLRR